MVTVLGEINEPYNLPSMVVIARHSYYIDKKILVGNCEIATSTTKILHIPNT